MKIITIHLLEDFYVVFSHKKKAHFNVYALNDRLCLVWAASNRQNFLLWVPTVSDLKCSCLLHIADSGKGYAFLSIKILHGYCHTDRSLRKNDTSCLLDCSFIWESAAFPHEARHLKKSSSSELEDVFLVVVRHRTSSSVYQFISFVHYHSLCLGAKLPVFVHHLIVSRQLIEITILFGAMAGSVWDSEGNGWTYISKWASGSHGRTQISFRARGSGKVGETLLKIFELMNKHIYD
jgi:hypothetical protein